MIYEGTVVKTADFGAFVNFFGPRDGLVHISQLASERVAKTTDVVKEGDKVWVKLMGFDERGKVRLSMKVVDQQPARKSGRKRLPPNRRRSLRMTTGPRRREPAGFFMSAGRLKRAYHRPIVRRRGCLRGSDMSHKVEIRKVEQVTHNVRQFTFEKPEGFTFEPGQATDVSIDRDGWRDDKHPFTFTSLPDWNELQFTIKIYPDHHGLTEQIGGLDVGDRFIIGDAWGTIRYRGKGTFIAGGAGVTPFIAILRDLAARDQIAGHRLIFANRTEEDIILKQEFDDMDGLETIYVVGRADNPRFEHGRIDKAFLQKHVRDFSQHFYVCGPDEMVTDINDVLKELGADPDGLVFEK